MGEYTGLVIMSVIVLVLSTVVVGLEAKDISAGLSGGELLLSVKYVEKHEIVDFDYVNGRGVLVSNDELNYIIKDDSYKGKLLIINDGECLLIGYETSIGDMFVVTRLNYVLIGGSKYIDANLCSILKKSNINSIIVSNESGLVKLTIERNRTNVVNPAIYTIGERDEFIRRNEWQGSGEE